MSELSVIGDKNLPTQFQPEETFTKQAQLDAIIALAKKTLDLDVLENAIDMKIAEQAEFIEWWGNSVRGAGKPKDINAESALITQDKATELTGYSQPQVSRIKTKLKDVEKYREQVIGATAKKLNPDSVRGTEGTGENEWYTPAKYIEAVHQVLGTIDTDPASSALARELGVLKDYEEWGQS